MTTGGQSFSSINWNPIVSNSVFVQSGGSNVVEQSPQKFTRMTGRQTIIVTDMTTNYSWQIDVIGGINSLSGGYIGLFDQSGNYFYIRGSATCTSFQPLNNTGTNIIVTTNQENNAIPVNTIQITTPAADSGGRTYTLIFSRFAGVQPTIQKSLANAIAGNLVVGVTTYQFWYI